MLKKKLAVQPDGSFILTCLNDTPCGKDTLERHWNKCLVERLSAADASSCPSHAAPLQANSNKSRGCVRSRKAVSTAAAASSSSAAAASAPALAAASSDSPPSSTVTNAHLLTADLRIPTDYLNKYTSPQWPRSEKTLEELAFHRAVVKCFRIEDKAVELQAQGPTSKRGRQGIYRADAGSMPMDIWAQSMTYFSNAHMSEPRAILDLHAHCLLRAVPHENILPLVGICDARSVPLVTYKVYPLMQNKSLVEWWRKIIIGPSSEDQRCFTVRMARVMLGIARGLAHLHTLNLCLDVLRMDNILIADNDVPRIRAYDGFVPLDAPVHHDRLKAPAPTDMHECGPLPYDLDPNQDPDSEVADPHPNLDDLIRQRGFRGARLSVLEPCNVWEFGMIFNCLLHPDCKECPKKANVIAGGILENDTTGAPLNALLKEGKRPNTDGIDSTLVKLMHDCWHKAASERPVWSEIVDQLESYVALASTIESPPAAAAASL